LKLNTARSPNEAAMKIFRAFELDKTNELYNNGEPAPILRSVNEVKQKTWRFLTFADAISMTTAP
jgi:hypothetical protein